MFPRFVAQNGLDCGCVETSHFLQDWYTCPRSNTLHMSNWWTHRVIELRSKLWACAHFSCSTDVKNWGRSFCLLWKIRWLMSGLAGPKTRVLKIDCLLHLPWVSKSDSVMSNSCDRPHGLYRTWTELLQAPLSMGFSVQNGVGCHFLHQGTFLT